MIGPGSPTPARGWAGIEPESRTGERVAQIEGTVVHKSSNQVRVDTREGELLCTLRGRFRSDRRRRSPVVVGDRVEVSVVSPGEGVLEEILPRETQLTRSTAGGKAVVVAANMERLLVILSARDPEPRWPLADRVLVAAHRQDLEPAVGVNKRDRLRGDPDRAAQIRSRLDLYAGLGYRTFLVSALTGEGLDEVTDWLRDRSTVLTGHSGVGKTTLLNALDPTLGLETGRVSERTGKGRHTTAAVTLYRMPFRGYVADTPGFREFALWGMEPAEIGHHFREFTPCLSDCRFRNCLHTSEPGCAVRRAVEEGRISKCRYNSYLGILSSLS